jgi:PAS domain S-box-containing protein
VDDEPDFAELTATFLERQDAPFTVETARGGREGMDRLAEGEYDCVVSDYDMPGWNGIEFLEAVREEYPALPFVLFTGKGSEEVASRAISAGVSDYLQKDTGSEQYELLANRITNHVERTRTQRKLEERESHLRQAQAVSRLGSWETDIRNDEIYWSDEVYEIFGIDDETLIDHEQFLEYVHPEDRADVDERWEAALEGEEYDVEHRIVTGDGETRWVRERAEVTFDGDGVPVNALGVVQDITERKERERRLKLASSRLRALFEESPDMINFHDAEGDILKPNPRLCKRTGYDERELTGMSVWELDGEIDPERAKEIWSEMTPGDRRKLESVYRHRDGSTFPVEIHLRCLRSGRTDEERFVVISRDVSDRNRRKRELERRREHVETFLDALADDIPNHLRTARLHLNRERERGDPEYADRIEATHERIEALVEDIRSLVRAGTGIDDPGWVRLSDVARSSWENCRTESGSETFRIADDARIRADRGRLEELFGDLYRNACEHAGEGVTVRVGALEDGFYVEDDGTGIPPDARGAALEPGYTTSETGRGGYGLAIVREIARAHGWESRLTDGIDGGVRFEVTGAEIEKS